MTNKILVRSSLRDKLGRVINIMDSAEVGTRAIKMCCQCCGVLARSSTSSGMTSTAGLRLEVQPSEPASESSSTCLTSTWPRFMAIYCTKSVAWLLMFLPVWDEIDGGIIEPDRLVAELSNLLQGQTHPGRLAPGLIHDPHFFTLMLLSTLNLEVLRYIWPVDITWLCRATVEIHSVAGSSLLKARRPGTHCQTISSTTCRGLAVSVTSCYYSPDVSVFSAIEMPY